MSWTIADDGDIFHVRATIQTQEELKILIEKLQARLAEKAELKKETPNV